MSNEPGAVARRLAYMPVEYRKDVIRPLLKDDRGSILVEILRMRDAECAARRDAESNMSLARALLQQHVDSEALAVQALETIKAELEETRRMDDEMLTQLQDQVEDLTNELKNKKDRYAALRGMHEATLETHQYALEHARLGGEP